MSSTRGGIDPTNLYSTPAWATDAVLPHLSLSGNIVDAGCGEGGILARVAERCSPQAHLFGVEIEADRAKRARQRVPRAGIRIGDWLAWRPVESETPDLAIFNPPFGLAQVFIEHALDIVAPSNGTVAALLRFNWAVPKAREAFASKHPFDLGFLRRRCDFAASLKCKAKPRCGWTLMQKIEAPRPKVCQGCGGGVDVVTTDSSDYAWHLFGPGRGGRFFALDIPERGSITSTSATLSEVTP